MDGDDKNDCTDGSDEIDCIVVSLDESQYRKSYVPKPPNGLEKLDVGINMVVKTIDSIQELKSSYQIRLTMEIKWKDTRLMFLNLRPNPKSNIVKGDTARSLWMPPLEIPGALSDYNLDYEDKSSLLIDKESNGFHAKTNILHEGMLYHGSLNSVMLIKQLKVTHSCIFELKNYPFDIQFCEMKVIPTQK